MSEITNELSGDLIAHDCDVIVQQRFTRKTHGLSQTIARRLGVDLYAQRAGPSANLASSESSAVPGSTTLCAVELSNQEDYVGPRYVACLFAQYAPGSLRTRYPFYEEVKAARSVTESAALREEWFAQALDALALKLTAAGLKHVAFPHGIGCGLAGGAWPRYRAMIERWAAANPYLRVDIVKLA